MSDDFLDFGNDGPGASIDPPVIDTPVDTPTPGFGNNGGSEGDNGAGGGGGSTVDNGPPTQADIDNYKQQLMAGGMSAADAAKHVSTVLGIVGQNHPEWSAALAPLIKGVTNSLTPPGGGTTPPGGSGGPGTTDPMGLAAAAALAYQQFHNADQYTKQADQYGKILNPYGAYRDAAAQKLQNLQADPSSIADTPGYKFALQQMMGSVANRDNRSFGVGSGSTTNDMMTQAGGLASKTYNDTIKQYSDQAGVGIGPSAAASIYGLGMQGNIASQNNAVNALMSPFGPGNNTGGGGGLGGFDWSKLFNGAATPPGAGPGTDVVPYSQGGPGPPNDNTGIVPGGT